MNKSRSQWMQIESADMLATIKPVLEELVLIINKIMNFESSENR